MNVKRMVFSGMLRHTDTCVDFPERGIVLVTGANGSGKSTLVEGVAVAGWGKTLRGATPWNPNVKNPCVKLTTVDGLSIERKSTSRREELTWALDGTPGQVFESTTKAQVALEAVIGAWDVWRRCSVFSSHDAAHFTKATDGERKRLLESIIGLDRFDNALATCRLDSKTAAKRLSDAEIDVRTYTSQAEGARARIEDSKKVLATIPNVVNVNPVKELEAEGMKLLGLLDETRKEIRTCTAALREADNAGASLQATADQLRATLKRLHGDKCPTCSQAISEGLRKNLQDSVKTYEADAAAKCATARANAADVEAMLAELREEEQTLQSRYADVAQKVAVAKSGAADEQRRLNTRAQAEDTLQRAEKALIAAEGKLAAADAAADAARREASLLDTCDTVLGLKGVRAHVLGQALGGIEAVANVWLSRLVDGVTLRLSPYSEKKTGGVSDAIAINLEGYGAGFGYKASSGGERRRIDVALLLALAEVASAASGSGVSTLWFDEVFDSLDEEGIDRASEALQELASQRCVVVISHRPDLGVRIGADLHLRIKEGVVTAT